MSQNEHAFLGGLAINVDRERLSWPGWGAAANDSGLGRNRWYFDLRGMGWKTVTAMLLEEGRLLDRVRRASDMAREVMVIRGEIEAGLERDLDDPLWGLDLGVASATLALSAAGCVTFDSCNGGIFRETRHPEGHPLVAFFMRPRVAAEIEVTAAQAAVGVDTNQDGSLQVYSSSPWGLYGFAATLHRRRASIRAANTPGRRTVTSRATPRGRRPFA